MPEDQIDITLGVLNAVHGNSKVTQRSVAEELGVALGLVNAYLKRCVKKGYIKVRQAPANRYAYYLTPAGFAEKSRLTAEYLSHSFTFFRNARRQCSEILEACEHRDWQRVALAGTSDLAEIVVLCTAEHRVTLVGVIDAARTDGPFMGLPVVDRAGGLGPVDAVIVTDLSNPQAVYDVLAGQVADERILTPSILCVVRADDGGKGRRP